MNQDSVYLARHDQSSQRIVGYRLCLRQTPVGGDICHFGRAKEKGREGNTLGMVVVVVVVVDVSV